jgi:hypothetical protein
MNTSSIRVASTSHHRLRAEVEHELVPVLLDQRSDGLHGVLNHLIQIDGLPVEPDAAADDARDLQQVADDLGQIAHLPLDDLAGLMLDEILSAAPLLEAQ